MRRFLIVADERRDLVAASNQRIEHRRADVAGSPGQKDPHAKRFSLLRTSRDAGAAPMRGQRVGVAAPLVEGEPRKALKPR